MAEYIDRDSFLREKRELYCSDCERRKGIKNGKIRMVYEVGGAPCRSCGIGDVLDDVEDFPAADVVERDEGIRIGVELAAMHGSDATSQELEKAYLDGVEEGLRKARKSGRWIGMRQNWYVCSECHNSLYSKNPPPYCSACGADMRGE